MITYANGALLLEVVGCRCTAGVVHDHGGLTALNDVYRHVVSAAEGEYLRLAAPHGGVADVGAVPRVLLRADDASVPRAGAILAFDARQERHKVLRVREHVLGCGAPREEVVCFLVRDDVENGELVCDG